LGIGREHYVLEHINSGFDCPVERFSSVKVVRHLRPFLWASHDPSQDQRDHTDVELGEAAQDDRHNENAERQPARGI
jgi:hypothetical protein